MKLTPQHINTFCRWLSLSVKREFLYTHFFYNALKWKCGEVDEQRLAYCCHAFYQSGLVPDFVKEYWKYQVEPIVYIKGGTK